MQTDRRRLLQSLPSTLLASGIPSLWSTPAAAAKPLPAALLVPRTGPHAALGRSMERAATLAQGGASNTLLVFDTGAAAGAAGATREAMRKGAALILGPVFAGEVRAVVAAVGGRVPVVAFSNDAALLESGAFLLGITAAQGVGAVLRYARGRGVRRLALATGASPWGVQAATAARAAAGGLGLVITGEIDPAQVLASDEASRPDAVLTASGGDLARAAAALHQAGVQALGAFEGVDHDAAALAALEGAWLSAPDPAAFEPFARNFEGRNGSVPGVIAGLAYDAVDITAALRRSGAIDRSGLLAATGFKGVCGDVRFRDDGSATRRMVVLAVQAGSYRVVDGGGPA